MQQFSQRFFHLFCSNHEDEEVKIINLFYRKK